MKEQYPVIDGAESFFFKGNTIGVLISHGFLGTPQSVQFLGESLAQKGFTVYAPRLKGHGTHYEDMERCSYHDWLHSLEEGYQLLTQHCEQIFAVGQSMGGALTAQLASRHAAIAGIVLINAAISSIPVLEPFRHQEAPRFIEEGAPDIKDESVYEITYTKAPLSSIQQLLLAMDDTREKLHHITCPVLAFTSLEDHVVPPENTHTLMKKISSSHKKTILLNNSYHVASMDYDKEYIAAETFAFIEELSAIKKQ